MNEADGRRSKSVTAKVFLWIVIVIVVLAAASYTAFQVSPRPAVFIISRLFKSGGSKVSEALGKQVPSGIVAKLDQRYDEADDDAYLDVFYPSAIEGSAKSLPTVVWVHGGAWIAGSKDEIANYLRILAGKGYTTVGVNYSLAPDKTYPTPVRQTLAALAYLEKNAGSLHVDPSRIILAGDSAGAQIAAQTANVISVPSYAEEVGVEPMTKRPQLRGVILYCGPYDIGFARPEGILGIFVKTVLWSYSGSKDYMNDQRFARYRSSITLRLLFPRRLSL